MATFNKLLAVLKASNAVLSSKKLKQFVSLVLALGNYLNYSKHNGNASGMFLTMLLIN